MSHLNLFILYIILSEVSAITMPLQLNYLS